MESILELGVPYGKGEIGFSFSGDSVEQNEFKTMVQIAFNLQQISIGPKGGYPVMGSPNK